MDQSRAAGYQAIGISKKRKAIHDSAPSIIDFFFPVLYRAHDSLECVSNFAQSLSDSMLPGGA